MTLGELLRHMPDAKSQAKRELSISSLAYDSRSVTPGGLFFAIQGEKIDGHRYISGAFERGAVAIVSERPAPPDLCQKWVTVSHIRRALSTAGRTYYGDPGARLHIVGITGTNGKTTTSFILQSMLNEAGFACGLIGTIEYRIGTRVIPAKNTTPESLDLWGYFADLEREGRQAVVMEVSSHALAQERVWGIPFRAAAFTNLTRDHLDYHKDFESYFAAKRQLFDGLGAPPPSLAVINADDPWARRLLGGLAERQITFGFGNEADVRPRSFAQDAEGIHAIVETPSGLVELRSQLIGRANLANLLAAAAAAEGLGAPLGAIRAGAWALDSVPGRFERVDEGQPYLVVVDYAHTDDALRNLLTTAREMARRRLIVVFGCGGERDRAKRPLMGEVAGSLSDFAVLTSDNPRGEDPLLIMSDAMVGLQRAGKPYAAEVDREAGIGRGLSEAAAGDVVLIAGKGHETYQIINDRILPFDDREVARRILRDMGYSLRRTVKDA